MIVCDRTYALVQLEAAEAARLRVIEAARRTFGSRAEGMVDRALAFVNSRMRDENPEIFE